MIHGAATQMAAELSLVVVDIFAAAAEGPVDGHGMHDPVTAYGRAGVVDVRAAAARVPTVPAMSQDAGAAHAAVRAADVVRPPVAAREPLGVDDRTAAAHRVVETPADDRSAAAARVRPVVVHFRAAAGRRRTVPVALAHGAVTADQSRAVVRRRTAAAGVRGGGGVDAPVAAQLCPRVVDRSAAASRARAVPTSAPQLAAAADRLVAVVHVPGTAPGPVAVRLRPDFVAGAADLRVVVVQRQMAAGRRLAVAQRSEDPAAEGLSTVVDDAAVAAV